MRALLFVPLFSFFGLCGGQPLPSLGKVDVASLCDDHKRCEVRGDGVYNALAKSPPPYLARDAGPEQYLGKVTPERNPRSVLKTCGAAVTEKDWLSGAPVIREVTLDKDGKQRVRDGLKAQLVRAMDEAGLVESASADLKSNIDAAVSSVDFQKVSLVEQTYWLTDAAFERRVGQCGDDFYEQVIYSVTVHALAELFQKDLELKLGAALAAKLVKPAEPLAEPSNVVPAPDEVEGAGSPSAVEGDVGASSDADVVPSAPNGPTTAQCQAVARAAVGELARASRFVSAFGFDDR